MSDDSIDWRPLADGGPQFGHEASNSAYDEARAKALARDDLVLLEHYYGQYGTRFAGLTNIVEFGLTLTHGSDWLSEKAEALSMADIVVHEVYAASKRLMSKPNSNIRCDVLSNRRDVGLLPMCNLLYSVLSLRPTRVTVLAEVLGLLLPKVVPGGLALLRAPTQDRLYQFMLPGEETGNQLNVIPQWVIFELLESNGFSLVLVQADPILRTADVLYTTILARRH